MTNEEFLKNWYHTVWIERDFAAGVAAFSDETYGTYVAGNLRMQPSDYETLIGSLCRDFCPREIRLNNVLSVDTEISALVTIAGERVTDRAPMQFDVHVYRKIENGKFVASYSAPDHMGFYIHMGQLPPDMMATLMMGGSLTE